MEGCVMSETKAGKFGSDDGAVIQLAYGENRCQSPAILVPEKGNDDPLAMHRYVDVSGDPSYISVADGDQIQEVLCLLVEAYRNLYRNIPYIAIAGKHGNPCGVGVDSNSPTIAIEKALRGDVIAVMGGEVITNFSITDELANTLFLADSKRDGRDKWGLDIIFAPEFSKGAVELLGNRAKRRVMVNKALFYPFLPLGDVKRPVRGGTLFQKRSPFILSFDEVTSWSNGVPISDDAFSDLLIAWAACWRASSNTVALAKNKMLIALGCGQQDRIACVELCLSRAKRAGHDTHGSFFASDAFFPYAQGDGKVKEGPELLAEAGCAGGVVPADGKNFEKVKSFFVTNQMRVAFVAAENRGFSKH